MQSTCKSCHEKLTKSNEKDIARKCSKCQSWQNWRRHLDLIALILGVVVSIAIIVGTVVIPLFEIFSSKHASMKMTVVSSSDNEMNILLANVGELPAGIKEAFVHLPGYFNTPAGKEHWGTMLKPGEVKILDLQRTERSTLPVIADRQHNGYEELKKISCDVIVLYKELGTEKQKQIKSSKRCYNSTPTPETMRSKRYY